MTARTPTNEDGGAPRLLIADDDPLTRSILSMDLGGEFDVVATARDADEAIALARELLPAIAILDVQMPAGGGLHAAEGIHEASPQTTIVALSVDESHDVVLDMLNAGAVTYVRKGTPSAELTAILHQAMQASRRLPGDEPAQRTV